MNETNDIQEILSEFERIRSTITLGDDDWLSLEVNAKNVFCVVLQSPYPTDKPNPLNIRYNHKILSQWKLAE